MAYKFLQVLRTIGKACQDRSLTEAEVEKLFQQHDFFLELGYEGIGRDIQTQRPRAQKRYDIALLGFGGRVSAIIEFKKPGADLDSFKDDLHTKYVRPHLALFGVLTDGIDMLLYARVNGNFVKQLECRLAEATEAEAHEIAEYLSKRKVDLESLGGVLEWLRQVRKQPLPITGADSEGASVFFQVFQLSLESAFGRLVVQLKDALPRSMATSGFTRGSYEFWQKTYARELKFRDVPISWRPFLLSKSNEEIARFSFALETGYTIISRLVLAKAADDRRFPGVRFLPRLQESYNELSTRGRLKPDHHLEVVHRCFQRAGECLFQSIFSQDIFDWWLEARQIENRLLCLGLAESLLTLAQFDFEELSGDVLGDLYQHYFDRDTRKALGEFYTPPEAIEFILDECGYKGQRGDRLLDPACGSGSFLVAALRRYLAKQSGADKEAVLRDLTEGFRIVGFDINPFAVLMSQVNYAALILPLYAEAVLNNLEFRLIRLPVFRTDSLRIEEREVEADAGKKDALQVNLQFQEKTLRLTLHLPLEKGKGKGFVKMLVEVPRFADIRSQGLVANLEEYVAALSLVFQAARDGRHSLANLLRSRFPKAAQKLAGYLNVTLEELRKTVETLGTKYQDGRFLKTIEDLVLAVSLKHDLSYDFVVGNPPYVRIQKIPEHVKEYWEGKYEWPEHNYDLYIPFLERTVQAAGREGWLKAGGRLGFIVSDRFLNVEYATGLREQLPGKMRVELVLDFRDTRVFTGALNYPAIIVGKRGNGGREGELLAGRIFSSDTPLGELLEEFQRLRKRVPAGQAALGTALEVFAFERSRLRPEGWWLMPGDERRVFDKLRAAPGEPLLTLTASASGGFAGYQTSADSVLVLDDVEDRGATLELSPRHAPGHCGCGREPVEIEKEAVRPFLFGKDVGRWQIDWKHSWVLFPYDLYRSKQRTAYGEEEIVERWNLIPSRENIKDFEITHGEIVQTIEERFPKAWKYLKGHEEQLRARENDKYAKEKPAGRVWYEATYPRGLDFYFRPKLVLQLLARRSSVAFDTEGRFVFQAGGKGGGVYGIVPEASAGSPRTWEALLNSRLVDFLIKEISSVYGGRFYSYGDQFLRDLPIAERLKATSSRPAKELANGATRLWSLAEQQRSLRKKLEDFPESFGSELAEYELLEIANLASKQPPAAGLVIEPEQVAIEKSLYGYEVHFGGQSTFDFEDREHAECVAEGLRERGRGKLDRKQVQSWKLPVKPEGCRRLLQLAGEAKLKLQETETEISAEERKLNSLVYESYGLDQQEQRIVEDFLARYSSKSATSTAEDAEGQDE